ncbi:hypothetical protein [Cryobacterium sp. M23]|uniref:hypothetical protein n=1 Tax=Cryobacterium sp. M23 TaxID=2048292 RepID=UPI001E3B7192|nr:hypothetical protein [Cryobacterium sp. M23]
MTTTRSTPPSDSQTTLRTGRLGVIGIVFFVVAAAAPLVGMTGAVPVAIVLGNGAAAPGAYLAIQLAIYGFFGGLLGAQVGLLPWWAWALLAWATVTLLSLLSVDVGAKVLGVLMLLELLALVVTSVAILADGGPEGLNFWASFNPAAILAGELAGSAGIAFAFAFASFIGFEATAIYGEESKDPKTVVPRATYLAVGVITALFALTAFAMVTGMGASSVVEKTVELSSLDGVPLAEPAAVLFSLATQYVAP